MAASASAAAATPSPDLDLWELGIDLHAAFDRHVDAHRSADAYAAASELANRLLGVTLEPRAALKRDDSPEFHLRETELLVSQPALDRFGFRGSAVLTLAIEVSLLPDSQLLESEQVATIIENAAEHAGVAKICAPLIAALHTHDNEELAHVKDATLKQLADAFAKRGKAPVIARRSK
jgi:hypothetical protein